MFLVLCMIQGVRTEERNMKGETARALAMMYGHTKTASLIDMHVMRAKSCQSRTLASVIDLLCRECRKTQAVPVSVALYEELSSSEEENVTPRVRARTRTRGPSIHDGPQVYRTLQSRLQHGARTIYAIYHRLYQCIFTMSFIPVMCSCIFSIIPSSLQCHMIFRNHSNILIFCSRNIYDYYQC